MLRITYLVLVIFISQDIHKKRINLFLHKNSILLVCLFISLYFGIVTEITSILKIKNAKNISNISEKLICFLVTYISLLKNKTDIAVPEAKFYINMISAVYFKISKWQRDRAGTVTQSLKYLRWSSAYDYQGTKDMNGA